MDNKRLLTILGVATVIIIMFVGSVFVTYKIAQAKNFNDLVNSANKKLNAGNCDEAITLYNKALQIKNDNGVQKDILIAQNCKQNQDIYSESLKLMDSKRYSEAMQKLSTINQASGQIYTNAQSKIEECKKNIITEDIQATNNAISNKDYDSANKYVADILKLDANNGDAKQLKTTIEQAQQKDKDEAEQRQQSNSKSTMVSSKETNSSEKNYEANKKTQSNQNELTDINSKLRILEYYISGLDKGSQEYIDALDYKASLLRRKIKILESQ